MVSRRETDREAPVCHMCGLPYMPSGEWTLARPRPCCHNWTMTTTARVGALLVAWGVVATVVTAQPTCPEQLLDPVRQPGLGEFGFDLGMHGRHLIVGDPASDVWCGGDPLCGKGAAYAYTYDEDLGEWVFLEFIFPDDIAEPRTGGFGPAVDVHEDRAIIGAYGAGELGGAYIFEFDGTRWAQIAQLLPPNDPRRYPWGEHAAIWGDRAIFGNGGEAVMVFRFDGDAWQKAAMLTSPDSPTARSDFGDAMDIDDTWIVIGAFGEDIFGPEHGAVYLYRYDGDNEPVFTQKLLPPTTDEFHRFGYSVAIDGDTLVVGANLSRRTVDPLAGEGAAFVYRWDGDNWELQTELEALEPRPGAYFGSSVAVDGDVIAVGSTRDALYGAAHVFRRAPDGDWLRAAYVTPSIVDLVPVNIGESVALGSGMLVMAGSDSRYEGADLGSAHAFQLDCLVCRADFDADGRLTLFDFLAFQNAFQDGDASADFDGDGELTLFDFLAFQNAFDVGCS
ncbi:MAG: FG-GAP repeat protein [Planctomycetota bacterium]